MKTITLIQKNHPSLKKICEPIDFNNEKPEDYKEIIAFMTKEMIDNKGMGLAANQVGIFKRLVIMNTYGVICSFLNPIIIEASGKFISQEGCLSFRIPTTETFKVRRNKTITISYYNENFDMNTLTLYDMSAACAQHEIDHLDGITMRDRWAEQRRGKKYF